MLTLHIYSCLLATCECLHLLFKKGKIAPPWTLFNAAISPFLSSQFPTHDNAFYCFKLLLLSKLIDRCKVLDTLFCLIKFYRVERLLISRTGLEFSKTDLYQRDPRRFGSFSILNVSSLIYFILSGVANLIYERARKNAHLPWKSTLNSFDL